MGTGVGRGRGQERHFELRYGEGLAIILLSPVWPVGQVDRCEEHATLPCGSAVPLPQALQGSQGDALGRAKNSVLVHCGVSWEGQEYL